MSASEVPGSINVLCAGLLAGEELVIRYGVRRPVASLEERSQTRLSPGRRLGSGADTEIPCVGLVRTPTGRRI